MSIRAPPAAAAMMEDVLYRHPSVEYSTLQIGTLLFTHTLTHSQGKIYTGRVPVQCQPRSSAPLWQCI